MALKDDIRKRVMQNMGELMPDTDSLNDILSFDMDSMMSEAHRRVVLAAPLYLLDEVNSYFNYPDQVKSSKISGGVVHLSKDDFHWLRIISVEFSCWECEVPGTEVITPNSPLYFRQKNKMTRGGCAKPVVVDCGYELRCYSVPTNSENITGVVRYYPDTAITDETFSTSLFNPNLLDAIAWMTTALLFDAMEEDGNAEVARTRCNELLAL